MNNQSQSPIPHLTREGKATNSKNTVGVSLRYTRFVEKTNMTNNPKIDRQLLAEYERLVDNSKGAIRTKKPGADYHLSHPFGSNVVPTDPREIGKRLSDVRRS